MPKSKLSPWLKKSIEEAISIANGALFTHGFSDIQIKPQHVLVKPGKIDSRK